MTILWGDTGKASIGSLKTFTITPGTVRETLLGTPLILPTTEPATSQVIYTIQASDIPTISPIAQMKCNMTIVCSGKIGAIASIINYRVLKNGISIAQAAGTSATATQFWTHTHWRTFDVVVGDVLEVRYWAVQADVNLDFYGLLAYPSQPMPHKAGTILKDLSFLNTSNGGSFTTITPTISGLNYYVYPNNSSNYTVNHGSTAVVYPAIITPATTGLFRNANADVNGTQTVQVVNATNRTISKQTYPSTISFREVLR